MAKYRVWAPDQGETEEEAHTVLAATPRVAAEVYVELNDESGDADEHEVCVLNKQASDVVQTFVVYREVSVTFTARLKEVSHE